MLSVRRTRDRRVARPPAPRYRKTVVVEERGRRGVRASGARSRAWRLRRLTTLRLLMTLLPLTTAFGCAPDLDLSVGAEDDADAAVPREGTMVDTGVPSTGFDDAGFDAGETIDPGDASTSSGPCESSICTQTCAQIIEHPWVRESFDDEMQSVFRLLRGEVVWREDALAIPVADEPGEVTYLYSEDAFDEGVACFELTLLAPAHSDRDDWIAVSLRGPVHGASMLLYLQSGEARFYSIETESNMVHDQAQFDSLASPRMMDIDLRVVIERNGASRRVETALLWPDREPEVREMTFMGDDAAGGVAIETKNLAGEVQVREVFVGTR